MEQIGSQNVECERCGGRDFRLDDGYYYCTECQLRSQDFREHVLEDMYGGAFLRTKKVKDAEAAGRKTREENLKDTSHESSWEILNYALKGLVDELILLGAPKNLKYIVLQLWVTYLRKTEIAFTSKVFQKKPKLGIYHRRSDAVHFYKGPSALKQFPQLKKRKRKGPRTSSGKVIPKRRKHLTKEKRALATAEYNESFANSSVADSQTSFNLSTISSSLASLSSHSSKSTKTEKISYSRKGISDVKKLLSEIEGREDDVQFHGLFLKRVKAHTVQNATLTVIISILRIGLLISGSNVHFGDMMRWMEEGYFSLDCLHKFIPANVTLAPTQIQLICRVPQYKNVAVKTVRMVNYLAVTDDLLSPSKLISALVKRYCAMLNLPDVICVGVDRLLEMEPPKASLRSLRSNFEARAMALILFSLKILIGLDDTTEFAYVPRKGTEGVKWDEWCRQYNARMAKKALTHHPTLCRLFPHSYIARDHSLLSHWDPCIGKAHHAYAAVDPETKESIDRLLKPLVCRLPEPTWKPGLSSETGRTGSPLAVLSEPVDYFITNKEKTVVYVKPYRSRQPKLEPSSSKNKYVRLLDKDDLKPPDLKALYTVDEVHQKKKSISSTTLPDFNIWMYHFKALFWMGDSDFDEFIPERLPFSFVWLLGEMASMIHQSKKLIYLQLMNIENIYTSGKKKHTNW